MEDRSMSRTILLTGATGFLGGEVARRLVQGTDCTLVALVRGEGAEAAARRLARGWSDWPEPSGAIGGRVQVLCGDVALPQLGLDDETYAGLIGEVTQIVHVAADLRLNAPIDELRATNVQGVANVLELARAARKSGKLERLAHVSTAYVAGRRTGDVPEDALTDAFGFSSAYERTKYEGERLVQAARDELPVSIFRPGFVVGDSHSGAIRTSNTLYYPLRLYLAGKLRVLPARRELRVNLVPVDYVAEAIVHLIFAPEAAGLTFHLTAPDTSLPMASELIEATRRWALEHLRLRLPRPIFLPLPLPRTYGRARRGTSGGEHTLGPMSDLLPYMSSRQAFRRDNVDRLLGPYTLSWREYLPRLLEYGVYTGFLHRSGRTVHEQILYRLGSKSRRVTYHDLADGKRVTRSAAEVRAEIVAAAGALRTLGIGPGDAVAMTGLNSTRYLALDVAIGLLGAVSVPLYYTSPPAEVAAIVEASGAKLLLVGTPRLLERLGELVTPCCRELPIVSFCREPVPADSTGKVMGWEAFLALGAGQGSDGRTVERAPVELDSLATLRYTSGTTGQSKGAMFTHAHLRWLAEVTASLLPWQARNRTTSWLSCLPMNHVVEGILATYAPYYIPAPLEITFLENIHELSRALPQIRPSAFFSVPRIYERVWDAFAESGPGRFYLGLGHGAAGRGLRALLRPLLRQSLLRKAGLDRCAMLIVGSAPVPEGMVRAYRELGIEVHNAYGLTEAPLVALNRPGANHLGTVGQPLPETKVRIAADGEVLVQGPQVTAGYYRGEPACVDGWLLTGDLGQLTDDGRLMILGRKKELIKTSYGKYIHPGKVEALLKEIPGVVEAMVVGEGRPYCVGLLWARDGTQGHRSGGAIDRAIAEANTRLSHPEQVKRWALLPANLSVEGGQLTANLKLKRHVVGAQYLAIVDGLYGGKAMPGQVLHVGQAAREQAA
jgi:long-chain acyl-CoA synthetase